MTKQINHSTMQTIQNNIQKYQRTMLFLTAKQSIQQLNIIHSFLATKLSKPKLNVLWCHNRQRQSSFQKQKMSKGQKIENKIDPLDLFVSSIKYTFYDETQTILGNTYQMLILQNFQSLTPNILCRTIETVEGGGIIIFLTKNITNLKQLSMDVHQKYKTEAFMDVEPRFNHRFMLSLNDCKSCLFLDEELKVISKSTNSLESDDTDQLEKQIAQKELQNMKKDLSKKQVIGNLIQTTKTLDQAKVIISLVEALMDKSNKTTISLNAARGRGKSSTIGLSIAAALKLGYSNIFVTAPTPNNLKTLFEFVVRGLEFLGFSQKIDFDIITDNTKEYQNAVMKINIFKSHTQFVQYLFPFEADKIGHADLIVIDEAAAIPIQNVRSFFGPHFVFLSSTVNGYEGTGRSLSLKLIQQIKEQNRKLAQNNTSYRKLKQLTMTNPIRYAENDSIQKWLNSLLLLNATQSPQLKNGIPKANDCQLFLVNRDTLFSFKKSSEKFFWNLMSLFIASHYKNSPNDLQLLADSPSQLLFVLVGPLKIKQNGKTQTPDILCAIQVALEGSLSENNIKNNSQRGSKPSGDLIPWNMRQQFQDFQFAKLAGARVIRIATHSMVQKMGYGSKALNLLVDFLQNKMISNEENTQIKPYNFKQQGVLQPLLQRLQEISPPQLSYIGTSFGFTTNLVKFWRKNGFQPVYVRQTVNDITSEHSGIMLRQLETDKKVKIINYVSDFNKRFINLLGFEFRKLSPGLALEILENTNDKKQQSKQAQQNKTIPKQQLKYLLSSHDLNRLKSYSNNESDYHLIIDLVPILTKLYFQGQLGVRNFNYTWEVILVGIGLQHKTIEQVTREIWEADKNNVANSLALFHKAMVKLFKITKQILDNTTSEVHHQKSLHFTNQQKNIQTNQNNHNNFNKHKIKVNEQVGKREQDSDLESVKDNGNKIDAIFKNSMDGRIEQNEGQKRKKVKKSY